MSRSKIGSHLLSAARFGKNLPNIRCKFYFEKTDKGLMQKVERMIEDDPIYCNVYRELKDYTGLDDCSLIENLLRTGGKSVNAEFNIRAPRSVPELYWYYQSSEKYLFENALMPFWQVLDCHEVLHDKSNRILDYGAGVGNNIIYLAEHGHVSLDYLEISIIQREFFKYRLSRRAGIAHSVKVLETCINPLNCVRSSYDVIILHDVLEHIPEYDRTLCYLINHLSEGGYIFESTFFELTTKDVDIHFSGTIPLEQVMQRNGMASVRDYVWRKAARHDERGNGSDNGN